MIYVRLAGGLGNQLFQLAAALHVQNQTHMPISFFTHHLKNYETPREYALKEIVKDNVDVQFTQPNKFIQTILKYRLNKIFPSLFTWSVTTKNINQLPKKSFYVLDDYFQDIANMQQAVHTVAAYIKKTALTNTVVSNIVNQFFKNNVIAGVHIRQGDYLNASNKSVFCSLSKEYYQNIIKEIATEYKLVFFSDAQLNTAEYTTEPVQLANEYKLTDVQEFLLMAQCQYLIIANSTFSFWAALAAKQNGAKVIAPKNWYYNNNNNQMWLNNINVAFG